MELVVSLVQVLLVSSAAFFLWLAVTDGRIRVPSFAFRRPATPSFDRLAGGAPALLPRTIRQTPLG